MIEKLKQISNFSEDDQKVPLQFDFSGNWLPDLHPFKVGNGNFTEAINCRATDDGVDPISGYTKINPTPIATYIKGRAGYQLRTPYTIKSYIFTQQFDTNLANPRLFRNVTAPPGTGDFDGSAFFTDGTGATKGRFTDAPDNSMIYCNSVETKIYGGDEVSITEFTKTTGITGLTPTVPFQYFTNALRNTLQTTGNVVALDSTTEIYFVASTRQLSGVNLYFSVFNVAAAKTLAVQEWTGSAWGNVTTLSDGTIVGGTTHAKNGSVTWDSTVTTSKPALIDGRLLYWYKFSITAGCTCTLYHVTNRAPIQDLNDLWDGINRICIGCHLDKSSVIYDYTPEVYDVSTIQYPIDAYFGGLTNTDEAYLIFSERMTAIKFAFIAGLVNTTAATVTIKYWNGSAWTSVGTVYDGTLNSGGTISMSQNGTMFWNPPAESAEFPLQLYDKFGYAYQLTWSATLKADTSGSAYDGCHVDTIYGIPAVKTMKAYKFAFTYKNRVFLAAPVAEKEGNSMDFGVRDLVDCYNGADSSFGSNRGRLYFGSNNLDVNGACNVFNRYGASLYDSELVFKPTEVYLLDGDSASNFAISQISENIGLSSPDTLVTAEIAFEVGKGAIRNIAMWISAVGPYIFDAAVLVPIPGIESYFDKTKTTCVNFDALDKAHGWFDSNHDRYNVCLPVGVGQTTCNVWLTYCLTRRKWELISTGSQPVPQSNIKVIDDKGNTYFYGLIDSGHMVRLDNGVLWNETEAIQMSLGTGLMLLTNNIFDRVLVRNVKVIADSANIIITYTRNDYNIYGYGLNTGDAHIYNEIIEDPFRTEAAFEGDNLVCAEFIEGVTLPGTLKWQDVGGTLSIVGEAIEGWVMAITTTAGSFSTAGFVVGLNVTTNDTLNPGPYLCSGISIDSRTMYFATGRAIEHLNIFTMTLTAYLITVACYIDGTTTPVYVALTVINSKQQYVELLANCDFNCYSVKLRFAFFSVPTYRNIKPLFWGIKFLPTRTD